MEDKVLFEGRPDLRGYTMQLTLLSLLSLATYFICVPFLIYFIFKVKNTKYRISDKMLDVQTGIIWRKYSTMDIWRIKDLQLHRGLIDRMVGTGAIRVISIDKIAPSLLIKALPNSEQIYKDLREVAYTEREKRKVTSIELS